MFSGANMTITTSHPEIQFLENEPISMPSATTSNAVDATVPTTCAANRSTIVKRTRRVDGSFHNLIVKLCEFAPSPSSGAITQAGPAAVLCALYEL